MAINAQKVVWSVPKPDDLFAFLSGHNPRDYSSELLKRIQLPVIKSFENFGTAQAY